MSSPETRLLVICADDYGYWPSYNRGILEAARGAAVDAVSAMVERDHCDPGPLRETGVEIGLHLDFDGRWGARSGAPARVAVEVQLERFADLFRSWPAFIDGHHHCHARPEMAGPVADLAAQLGIPVRSVGAQHRELLEQRKIPTQQHLIGRLDPSDPVEPPQLRSLEPGVTIWSTHPGHPDPESGSAYDWAREEDLNLLLRLGLRSRAGGAVWGEVVRATHAEALRPR